MTGPSGSGRCLLVDVTDDESGRLGGLPGGERATSGDCGSRLAGADPVDLVVIGSLAGSPVSVVQRVHRAAPDASIAVLSTDPDATRRTVAFAPEVPLHLLIAGGDEPDLLDRLRRLREASIGRRRHAAVLAAISGSASQPASPVAPATTAVGALLEHAPIAVVVSSPSGDLLGWNRRAEILLQLQPSLSGHPVTDIVPGVQALLSREQPAAGPQTRAGVPPTLEVSLGGGADVEISAVPSQTGDGTPVVLLLAADVTARRRAERERDRLAGHVELLGRISESLMESLDFAERLSGLAGDLVPAIADWVAIELHDRGQLVDLVVRHRDPELASVAAGAERRARARGNLTGIGRRAGRGERVLISRADGDTPPELDVDADLRPLVERLGVESLLAVPLPGRTAVLGSLLLGKGRAAGRFDPTDLALAAEVGRRAGIALDNARLYAGQQHLAAELQRSLLTAPPTVPFADIAVRYLAAAQEAQVGGDWYDAFRDRTGDLVLVIGDVVGHDTRAAAAMGQLRGLVRGLAFGTAQEPGRVVTAVDEAIDGLELSTMATAVLAVLCPPVAGEGSLRLRWANAGHPPPVLLDGNGRARALVAGDGRADLLLGIDPTAARRTEETVLSEGATLILYTDGLVERRGLTLDDGLDRLLRAVEDSAGATPEGLCDAILRAMVADAGEDDVAIVAVRARTATASASPRRG